MTDFVGAKLALFLGPDLVVIERDDIPHIAFPGHLDFPGGGREGGETAERCALRETWEELGLTLAESDLIWRQSYLGQAGQALFFVARKPAGLIAQIRFGNEGLGWRLMSPEAYLTHPRGIPNFRDQLGAYLSGTRG
ncbi:NUDIX hydrolase [Chachezhania sediminis]|uniref:NUDIX hydrolase n=1 Tax=Chachezhania sediminis TaxID=2599291 RepID=UPI00131E2418|nr:NUDIX hydrolase [Chachezhania sediminis]